MKILGFGSCNIDYVYTVDHIVANGETESAASLELFAGGKGLNQTIAAAKAGCEVFFAGCIGSDGALAADFMRENGVDVSYMMQTDEKSGHAIIQVDKNGSNSIIVYPGSNAMITEEYVDGVLEHFDAGDIIFMQNEINNIGYIANKAFDKGMTVVFNPSPFNEKIKDIDFNRLSCVILNEVEICAVSGCANPADGLRMLKKTYPNLKIMMTLGSRGCVYADGVNEIRQNAFEAEAVDTTAAGDTFTGYFVAGIAAGTDMHEILRRASAASAIAVSRKGAAPSIPCRDEVEKLIGNMSEKQCNK